MFIVHATALCYRRKKIIKLTEGRLARSHLVSRPGKTSGQGVGGRTSTQARPLQARPGTNVIKLFTDKIYDFL
jgi:hypothetical protein